MKVGSGGAADFAHGWSLSDVKRSAVNCLTLCDLLKDGSTQIVVGREDGRLEVYGSDGGVGLSGDARSLLPSASPSLLFSRDIGEGIRSVEVGMVNSSEYNEIIVATYSGKVLSYTLEPLSMRAQDDQYGRSVGTMQNESRIKHLKKELDTLKTKVDKEKDKLKKTSSSKSSLGGGLGLGLGMLTGGGGGGGGAGAGGVAPGLQAPEFPVTHKFLLDNMQAAYVLSIEVQGSALDMVIIKAPMALELVESETSGSSVVSITPPHLLAPVGGGGDEGASAAAPCRFVAAIRCMSEERRLSVTLR